MNTKHASIIEPAKGFEAGTVLVVEDNEAMRKMQVQMLRGLGSSPLATAGKQFWFPGASLRPLGVYESRPSQGIK